MNLVPNADFTEQRATEPAHWRTWQAIDSISPAFSVDVLDGKRVLRIGSRGQPATYGKWVCTCPGIEGGKTYRFQVLYRAQAVETEHVSIVPVLSWRRNDGSDFPVARDYVSTAPKRSGWSVAERTLVAPEDARFLDVELGLRWTLRGVVWWREPSLVEVSPLEPRVVRVAVTHLVPPPEPTVEKNLHLMCEAIDMAGKQQPDIVCLSENFVDRGVSQPVQQTAQPIPGPAAQALGQRAREWQTYVVTSLHERQGDLVFNTAVLIDRRGEVVGQYRKTHLPMSEAENGITPGKDYPVFDTDFGRIGILICWDNWFPEPARILAIRGAEIVFFPLAGDGRDLHWQTIWPARAIDNAVYLVASPTVGDAPGAVIDPWGNWVAKTTRKFDVAVAEIDLNERRTQHWLSVGPADGEARSLLFKERRPDTYGVLLEGD